MPSITPVSGVFTSPAAGQLPVTGVASGFSGPFLTETQTLTVYYARVPVLESASSSPNQPNDLSSNLVRTHLVVKTALNLVVEAVWKKVKDYNSYSTSSYTQMQKLGVQNAPDFQGNYYGAVSALSASGVLGPVGSVITTQPYINRRPWVEGVDSEASGLAIGSNVVFYNIAWSGTNQYYATFEQPFSQGNIYDYIKPAIPANKPHTLLNNADTHTQRGFGSDFVIPGTYATSKENGNTFAALITSISNKISLVPGAQSQQQGGFITTSPTQGAYVNPISTVVYPLTSDFVGLPQFNGNLIDLT